MLLKGLKKDESSYDEIIKKDKIDEEKEVEEVKSDEVIPDSKLEDKLKPKIKIEESKVGKEFKKEAESVDTSGFKSHVRSI
jgi:hypothetical protein